MLLPCRDREKGTVEMQGVGREASPVRTPPSPGRAGTKRSKVRRFFRAPCVSGAGCLPTTRATVATVSGRHPAHLTQGARKKRRTFGFRLVRVRVGSTKHSHLRPGLDSRCYSGFRDGSPARSCPERFRYQYSHENQASFLVRNAKRTQFYDGVAAVRSANSTNESTRKSGGCFSKLSGRSP